MSLCAVCFRTIHTGLLMCAHHWRMVPADQQKRVYKTHARFASAVITGLQPWHESRRDYEAARDAAVATVHAQQNAGRVLDTLASVTHHHTEGASL